MAKSMMSLWSQFLLTILLIVAANRPAGAEAIVTFNGTASGSSTGTFSGTFLTINPRRRSAGTIVSSL